MTKFVNKVRAVCADPAMFRAYLKWRRARLSSTQTQQLENGMWVTINERFTDYWSVVRQHPTAEEQHLFSTLMPKGGITFDVGANIGLYTVMAAREAQARVIAFEPMHRYAAAWHKNIELNAVPNATLIQCALADKPGLSDFTCDLTNPLNNRFVTAGASTSQAVKTRVSTITLDDVRRSLGIERIDLLKIDVEGAEPKVLRGARQSLQERAITTLFFEFIIEFMEDMGEDPNAVYNDLTSFGYTIHSILPNGTVGPALDRTQTIDARRVKRTDPERDFWGLNLVAKLKQ